MSQQHLKTVFQKKTKEELIETILLLYEENDLLQKNSKLVLENIAHLNYENANIKYRYELLLDLVRKKEKHILEKVIKKQFNN